MADSNRYRGQWPDEEGGASRESVEAETWRGEYPDTQDQRRQRSGYWGAAVAWQSLPRYDQDRGWGYQGQGGWGQRLGAPGTYGQPYDRTFDPELQDEKAEYGPFSGRGPKGYQRDDNRICEDVCERLTQHGQVDASDVEVEVKGGEVWLRGTVETRVQKRMAEDAAAEVSGVRDVHNELKAQTTLAARGGETVTVEAEPFLGQGRKKRSLE